jgi:hypothetical protein
MLSGVRACIVLISLIWHFHFVVVVMEELEELDNIDAMEVEKEEEQLLFCCWEVKSWKFHARRCCGWESEYLVDLAIRENSFVAEYCVDPGGFGILHELLGPMIESDPMARVSNGRGNTSPISSASKLGAALILLAGGRRLEAMRTHGVASCTVYQNLHRVIEAINSHPALAIECDTSKEGCKKNAHNSI